MHNQVLLLPGERDARLPFQGGVSLHGHTRHSRESLGFIGKFLQGRSCLRTWIEKQSARCERTTGIDLDFDRAYWTPPLCERQAYDLEWEQIAKLDLRPIVSLTDHNNIEASTLLRQLPEHRETPISTEWTVPFGRAIFHIGVHNLPAKMAQALMIALREATEVAEERAILRLLAELNRMPGVLLIFNHPVWNFNGIAPDRFTCELRRFLSKANSYLHGFELNGMRCHGENREVIRLAAEWQQLIVSGGDRHACEPNAAINLTNAADFPEFVDEIRKGKQSTVLLMPQYAEPLNWRFYQSFAHVVGEYPGHPEGRRRWDERTFHPNLQGEMTPMIDLWHGGGPPEYLKRIFALAIWAANFPVRGISRAWMSREMDSLLLPGNGSSRGAVPGEEVHSTPRFGVSQSPQIVAGRTARSQRQHSRM